jgi:D-inositol-3-phosphate glycosyltransferase
LSTDRVIGKAAVRAIFVSISNMASNSTVWIVDPISYTGLAYYDVGLVDGLQANGVRAVLVGAEDWLLADRRGLRIPLRPMFRGTSKGNKAGRGLRHIRSLLRLVIAAMREGPRLVHWQYLQLLPADILALLLIRMLRIPVVYTAHETVPWTATGRLARYLLRALYSFADAIVVHNEMDATSLRESFGIGRQKIRVIPHGDYQLFADPSMDQSHARSYLAIPQNRPTALFFGSLRPSKGLDTLLAAWPSVTEALPDAHLVIAGRPDSALDRRLIHTLEQMARHGRTAGSITARLDRIPDADINAYYRAADVVVLPYHAITTSGVLRYAYSSARPVIATAVGEHPLWVVPGVTGELIPVGDAAALASSLVRFLGNPAACTKLGLQALGFAREHFDWKRIGARTAELYSEVARPAPASGC